MKSALQYAMLDLWHKRTWLGRILFIPLWLGLPFIVLIDVLNFIEERTRK